MADKAIKQAFSKVKEDIKAIEAKFEIINKKLDQILQKTDQKTTKTPKFEGFGAKLSQIPKISSGNEGVQSINHSTITQQSLNNHSLSTQNSLQIQEKFNSLTNQEFLVFLTIYNLEDQLGRGIIYDDIASKISLTSSCVRSYISSMIKKNIPLIKAKLNNRTTILKINPHFRALNLKDRLTKLYLKQDQNQTTLF